MWAFRALFEDVPDPRAGNARHVLSDILLMAFAAMLCGAETCVDMADFAADKLDLLAPRLGLRHGAPSHDTFSRVLRLLDPAAFEAAFCRFMQSFAAAYASPGKAGPGKAGPGEAGRVLAVDGKSLRGAVDTARRSTPLHLVTVWAAEQRLVLGCARAQPQRGHRRARHPGPVRPAGCDGDRRRAACHPAHGRRHTRPRRRLCADHQGQPGPAARGRPGPDGRA